MHQTSPQNQTPTTAAHIVEIETGPIWSVDAEVPPVDAEGSPLDAGPQALDLVTPAGVVSVAVTCTPFPERTAQKISEQLRAALAASLPEATCSRERARVVVRGGAQDSLRIVSSSRAWRVRELVTGPRFKFAADVRADSGRLHVTGHRSATAAVLRWAALKGDRVEIDGQAYVVAEISFRGALVLSPAQGGGAQPC